MTMTKAFQPFRGDDPQSTQSSFDPRERDAHLAALRAAVQRGLDEIKAGEVADPDAALDRIEAMLDELEAAKAA
ncbi:MAG TPA: hypothetical protein VF650_06765 [Allosphingosinicella sp.]